ncbi:MAG: rRNA pseudouridine synthase [Candidatus Vogelbacteria bacterium]|nr:rRNA pseudouridine synthase [Candidatus Vogelbacteria bacterium]
MRINKYLANQGLSTRRGADELIERGLVLINGRKAKLGDKVNETDKVELKPQTKKITYRYFAYHKPRGVVTHSPQLDELDVLEASGLKNVFPIGRLDKSSTGLIILTNDGRVTDRLLNPSKEHEKEYEVTVAEVLKPSFEDKMSRGVRLEDYTTKPCQVIVLNDYTFRITLTEGKKHQIRRMCAALGYVTRDLKRTRILNLKLANMRAGTYREIHSGELASFLKLLGL